MHPIKATIILAIALGMAVGVTIPKLWTMCQIKGWLPGATATQETITQKWNETPAEHPRGRDTYWIGWSGVDIHTVGSHRINVTPEYWNYVAIGDQLEVVRLNNDHRPHLRDDIFVSAGNFVFDGILLAVEIAVTVLVIITLVRSRTQRMNAT